MCYLFLLSIRLIFLHELKGLVLGSVYIYDCFIFLMNWSFYHYGMTVSSSIFCLKSLFCVSSNSSSFYGCLGFSFLGHFVSPLHLHADSWSVRDVWIAWALSDLTCMDMWRVYQGLLSLSNFPDLLDKFLDSLSANLFFAPARNENSDYLRHYFALFMCH